MDELENQTIQMWRDSERTVAKLKSSLVQIDPMQRYVKSFECCFVDILNIGHSNSALKWPTRKNIF